MKNGLLKNVKEKKYSESVRLSLSDSCDSTSRKASYGDTVNFLEITEIHLITKEGSGVETKVTLKTSYWDSKVTGLMGAIS